MRCKQECQASPVPRLAVSDILAIIKRSMCVNQIILSGALAFIEKAFHRIVTF